MIAAAAAVLTSCSEKENWTYLLDENLSNFEIYQSFEFTTPEYHGYPLDENGEKIPQIGYNKNYKDLFTVDMVDGEIHRLDHGQIQLQSEGAECYYKQVRIRPIDSMPAEYAELFR